MTSRAYDIITFYVLATAVLSAWCSILLHWSPQ
jgi:hypothetical protein